MLWLGLVKVQGFTQILDCRDFFLSYWAIPSLKGDPKNKMPVPQTASSAIPKQPMAIHGAFILLLVSA